MRSIQKLHNATPDTIRQQLCETVEHLMARLRQDSDVLEELAEIGDLLASLPLASDEFGIATNRLRNAHRYLVSRERGAACFELRQLIGRLRVQDEAATGPRLRKRLGA